MINNNYLDPHTAVSLARLHAEELRRQSQQRRLIAEYRKAHPRPPMRDRTATFLRRVADRLAPEPTAPVRPLRPVGASRPSPS